jgi:micrococcal nuclease
MGRMTLTGSTKTCIVTGLSILFLCLVSATAGTAFYALGLDLSFSQAIEEPAEAAYTENAQPALPAIPLETVVGITPLEAGATKGILSTVPTSRPELTETATHTSLPTIEATPTVALPAIAEAACVPSNPREMGTVIQVIDGDTVEVEIGGEIYRLRYIGIDAPESSDSREALSEEATASNRAFVEGKTVTLVKDVSETDRYSRLLRFVFVGDFFVNYEMVRQGFATVTTYSPDVSCEATFLEGQQLAIAAGAGQWGLPTATLTPTRTLAPTATHTPVPQRIAPVPQPTSPPEERSGCHPSYPDICLAMDKGDYDCAGGSGNGPNYVRGPIRVLPPDPFDLDRDGDGIGCE